ncbi:TMEM175 family protein [Methylosinus sp. Ce-a6]|uniref:TMEM175 family protein n=1 Tax=Methylosinus sp. Ce-a6 TaxID=2172005 RepID=UPI00135A2873|nr:TMEM175 family protein [Methylosinus sp. Ce-a6]
MEKDRLAAFSDGVVAIIVTIMVLELKAPHSADWAALAPLAATFASYALSFVYVAIYWNNHHHLLYAVSRVNGAVLWANMHLLFWLSLLPFATAWMADNDFARAPTILYGVALLMPAIAYYLLTAAILRAEGPGSTLAGALGRDVKGRASVVLYLAAVAGAFFVSPLLALAIYVAVAIMWFTPDPRIERIVSRDQR